MEDDGDVLSETPNGANELEDKSTKENGVETRGKVGLRVLTLGSNFPASLQHQLLQRGPITGNSVWGWDTKYGSPAQIAKEE